MREADIIRILKSDKNLYGEYPSYGGSFQLVKAEFFYGDRFTPRAKERVEKWMKKEEKRTCSGVKRKELEEAAGRIREDIGSLRRGKRIDCIAIIMRLWDINE